MTRRLKSILCLLGFHRKEDLCADAWWRFWRCAWCRTERFEERHF